MEKEKNEEEKVVEEDKVFTNTSGAVISKNQLKKLKRKEQWDKEKESRKKIKREKEKEKRRKKNELLNQIEEKKEDIVMREPKKVWEEKLKQKMENGIKICIDCDYEHLMTEKEIISMCRQLTEIYSRNRKSINPFLIILNGLGEKLYENLRKNGFDKWLGIKYYLKNSNTNFIEDNKDKLIYLTGDSENTLETLDQDNIYIIGGIVDRNRHKFLTLNKAKDLNIKHAKLPLGEYIDLKSSKVLATNHVFDILCHYNSVKKDWKESFLSIIPQRKMQN